MSDNLLSKALDFGGGEEWIVGIILVTSTKWFISVVRFLRTVQFEISDVRKEGYKFKEILNSKTQSIFIYLVTIKTKKTRL